MRATSVLLCLFAAAFIVGCRSVEETRVSYNAKRDVTTYRTQFFTVARTEGEALAASDSKSIDVQAVAKCRGEGCAPDKIELVFSSTGSSPLSLSNAGGEILADAMRIQWTNDEAGGNIGDLGRNDIYYTRGSFAVVSLQPVQLREIATSPSVKGSIGGISLRFGSQVRAGFRSLLQKIESEIKTSPSSNS